MSKSRHAPESSRPAPAPVAPGLDDSPDFPGGALPSMADISALLAHPRELDHFNAQAASWWDADGPLKTLHQINPTRLAWIRTQAGGTLKGKRVIDVGCGGGLLAEVMAAEGAAVLGIDLAADALAAARAHAEGRLLDLDYREVAVEALAAEAPGTADIVTCMEAREHVPDPAAMLASCVTLLKPGGLLLLSSIQRTPKAFLLAIVAAEYVTGLVPRGTHRYEQFLKPSELARVLRGLGCELLAVDGLRYRPLRRDAVLSTDPSVNFLLAARAPV